MGCLFRHKRLTGAILALFEGAEGALRVSISSDSPKEKATGGNRWLGWVYVPDSGVLLLKTRTPRAVKL